MTAAILVLAFSFPILSGSLPRFLLVCFVAAMAGGNFAASMADDRKLRHCLYASLLLAGGLLLAPLIGVEFGIWMAYGRRQEVPPSDLPGFISAAHRLRWLLLGLAITAPLPFLLGGWLNRVLAGAWQDVFPREEWIFETRTGRKIEAMGPWRSPVTAAFWWITGRLFQVTCWVPLIFGAGAFVDNIAGALALFVLGQTCLTLARRRTSRSARDALQQADRPPIVYLRSFRHDGRRVGEGAWHDYSRFYFSLLTLTAEGRLARVMQKFGPFVAIGKPGEEVPEIGAMRMYVGDDDWQAVVAELLTRPGALAVLQAGETQGLRWELSRIGSELKAEQVLLVLPFGMWKNANRREAQYTEFRSWAEECLPARFPEKLGNSRFLYFTSGKAGWEPHLLLRESEVPPLHPLRPILQALLKDRTLMKARFSFLRGLVVFIAIVFLLVVLAAVREEFKNSNATYEGKAMPYRVTLSRQWREVAVVAPTVDRQFVADPNLVLVIAANPQQRDMSASLEATANAVRNLESSPGTKRYGQVRIVERKSVTIRGKEWLIGVITAEGPSGVTWLHLRFRSGPEGTFVMTCEVASDSPEVREIVSEAMDGFEPPNPEPSARDAPG